MLVFVLALAAAARLQPAAHVLLPEGAGARFVGDTDPYYHALRADRIAADFPTVPWRDDRMNYPVGTEILWPPLFDQAIATGAIVASGGRPSRETIERVAAWLPPILGVATVAATAALGGLLLGTGAGLGGALVLALLPSHVEYSAVGRADQHAAEILLQTLVMLAFVAGSARGAGRAREWAASLGLGLALCLSFWNWQGSALDLALLAAFAALWHVTDAGGASAARAARLLALGSGTAAVALVVSILLWGRPGALASMSLSGVNGIQPLVAASVALFAAGLAIAPRLRKREATLGRRLGEAAIAVAVPVLVLLPGYREGVVQGLLALTAGNPWYASIREFQPPLFGGNGIGHELRAWGPRFAPLFVMPFAAIALARIARRRLVEPASLVLLAVWGGALLLLTLARMRFALYLSVPASLLSWIAIREGATALGAALSSAGARVAALAAGAILLLAPALFYFSHGGLRPDPTHLEVIRALEWLRDRGLPDAERPAVFSEWDWGHLIQYVAGRPVVATPFGTDGGEGAMETTAAFFLATSPGEAERILESRRAGYLMMTDPLTHAAFSAAFAPPDAVAPVRSEVDRIRGPKLAVTPEVDDLVAVRVYYDNGMSSRGLPSLHRYRLVYEGSPEVARQVRLFEIVPGDPIEIRGARPGASVSVAVGLRTNRGRAATWRTSAIADGEGRATVLVPFSTGSNGEVVAGSYAVEVDGVVSRIDVPVK